MEQVVDRRLQIVLARLAVDPAEHHAPCVDEDRLGDSEHAVASRDGPARIFEERRERHVEPLHEGRGVAGRSWKFTPITCSRPESSRRNCWSTGSSSSHGWHHEAKKAITTGWPRSVGERHRLPAVLRSVKSGAVVPTLALLRSIGGASVVGVVPRDRRARRVVRMSEDQRQRAGGNGDRDEHDNAIAARDGRRVLSSLDVLADEGVDGNGDEDQHEVDVRPPKNLIAAWGVGVPHERERLPTKSAPSTNTDAA